MNLWFQMYILNSVYHYNKIYEHTHTTYTANGAGRARTISNKCLLFNTNTNIYINVCEELKNGLNDNRDNISATQYSSHFQMCKDQNFKWRRKKERKSWNLSFSLSPSLPLCVCVCSYIYLYLAFSVMIYSFCKS